MRYLVLGLIIILCVILAIWAVKHLIWIGIGVGLGVAGTLTYQKVAPYWTELKAKL